MATMRNSLLSRVAVQSMTWAVRVWPESSRQWGMAVLGEMGEIGEPVAALSWAAGGMLLFLRAMLAQLLQWMKLPVGGRLRNSSLPLGNRPPFPKHSRLATALVLLAAVTLLFLPMGREAARTVAASWRGFVPSQHDRQDLEKLAAKAEKEKDARMLAFVALTYPEPDRMMHFADEAVKLDPNLAWIYASRYSYRTEGKRVVNVEGLKALKNYDPANAVVYLVNAYAAGEPVIENTGDQKGGSSEPLGDKLAKNGEWMKEMEAGFRAQKYDNYFPRYQELAREGWTRAPELSPGAIAMGLWAQSIPNSLQIQTYAELRVREALQAGRAGQTTSAEDTLHEVTELGRRMSGVAGTPFERMVGLGLTKRGLEGYENLYRASGRTAEANSAMAQRHEVDTTANGHIGWYMGWREEIVKGLRWKALVLQVAAILSLLLAVAVGLSVALLEASATAGRRGSGWSRKAICRLVDYGPAALLVASLIVLWSFRPIALAFEHYRSGELANTEIVGLFWQLFTLGAANPALYFYDPYHQWLLATIALVGIGAFVVVRGLVRPKPNAAGR